MSLERYCGFFKAKNDMWYMNLASEEYEGYEKAYTYGPFNSMEEANEYLSRRFCNPGSLDLDESGTQDVPMVSPNGRPVQAPKKQSRGCIWAE
jgi:hypothetical protein